MKNFIKLQNAFFALLFLGLTVSFTACSSDDDDIKTVQLSDVIGNYAGEIKVEPIVEEATRSDKEEAEKPLVQVTADEIKISKLPFEVILQEIINNDEIIEEVLATVKDIEYNLGYTAEIDTEKNALNLAIKADSPFQISYFLADATEEGATREGEEGGEGEETPEEIIPNHTLVVSVEKEAEGIYKDNTLRFNLKVTEIKAKENLNETEGEGEETPEVKGIYTYSFSLLKN